MSLREYKRKRDFGVTPEPAGAKKGTKGRSRALRFVIQKHAASHLHYDFRLESDGVLKSWAIPRGPSLDPKERRLAAEVEDHPIEYGGFEGVIPKGEYGGGTVLLWDRGTWTPQESHPNVREALRQGHIKFTLDGEKLQGSWALVRMKRREGETRDSWLLIKEHDDAARTGRKADILKERPESVASGRSMEEIAATAVGRGEVWSSKGPPAKTAKVAKTAKATKPPLPVTAAVSKASKAAAKKATAQRPARRAKAALPSFVPPQLATLVSAAPQDDDWLFEIKLDGYRIEAAIAGGASKLHTRNEKDWTEKFPQIAAAVAQLPVDSALLDGEVVALEADGRTSFQALQNALKAERPANLVYFVFDLLHLNGVDLRDQPLEARKEALRELLEQGGQPLLRYSEHVEGEGAAYYREACRLGVEGIMAKRGSAAYRSGRGTDWLKVKCIRRQELVIGGFTGPQGTRTDLGALLLGVYEGDELRYAGKVGTGFDTKTLRSLRKKLDPLVRAKAPFVNPPRGYDARGVEWVAPQLVAEIAFTEWTDDGILRHPSFQGLREDKPAREVRREEPVAPPKAKAKPAKPKAASAVAKTAKPARQSPAKKAAPAPRGRAGKEKTVEKEESAAGGAKAGRDVVAGIHLSHPDRVLYPEQGLTKLDLATYYESVADSILPHLRKRPLSLVRCPQGSTGQCFYQKHLRDGVPDVVKALMIEEDDGGKEPYPYVDELAGIVALVQIGVLELHGWGALAGDVDKPDRLVFDLDPDPSVQWPAVVTAAETLRKRLADLGLESFVQTSGGKGLHILVPLTPRRTWDEVKPFARALAESVVAEEPDLYLSKASKAARKGKIFIDWLRNGRGATAIVPYSTRSRAGATVATPLRWEEIAKVKPTDFTVKTVPGRLAKLKGDPWEGFWKVKQSLRADVLKKMKLG